jgi:hypothetical protein
MRSSTRILLGVIFAIIVVVVVLILIRIMRKSSMTSSTSTTDAATATSTKFVDFTGKYYLQSSADDGYYLNVDSDEKLGMSLIAETEWFFEADGYTRVDNVVHADSPFLLTTTLKSSDGKTRNQRLGNSTGSFTDVKTGSVISEPSVATSSKALGYYATSQAANAFGTAPATTSKLTGISLKQPYVIVAYHTFQLARKIGDNGSVIWISAGAYKTSDTDNNYWRFVPVDGFANNFI